MSSNWKRISFSGSFGNNVEAFLKGFQIQRIARNV
jgi:hypothetical protein